MFCEGLKRPFSGPDSAKHLISIQPVSDSDGEQCSPECLLSLQPVGDDYSSDDCSGKARKKLKRSCQVKTKDKELNRKNFPDITELALRKINCGSSFKAEQSLCYLDVHYPKIDEEIPLVDKSLDECLLHLFKFSSSRFFDEHLCAWNSETITDIKERELNINFSWLLENDNIDWKTATPGEVSKHEQGLLKEKAILLKQCSMNKLCVAKKTRCLYRELQSNLEIKSTEDISARHSAVKECINAIAALLSKDDYLQNGCCADDFELYVPHDIVSDDSPLTPGGRTVVITNRPDGVFTYQPHGGYCSLWLIALQVVVSSSEKEIEQHRFSPQALYPGKNSVLADSPYDQTQNKICSSPAATVLKSGSRGRIEIPSPELDMIKSDHGDPRINGDRGDPRICTSAAATSPPVSNCGSRGRNEVPSPREFLPPKRSINSLLNGHYVTDARKHITEAVPRQCRSSECLDTIAGQHVLQLFSVARRSEIGRKLFSKGVIEALGIFVMNEYVYLSRLDIDRELLYYLSGAPYRPYINGLEKGHIDVFTKTYREIDPPSVSYSNFRLDLTIAKHRLALIIFIKNYRQAFVDQE